MLKFISDPPDSDMELLQYTRRAKLFPNRVIVIMRGHALLEQVDDIRENQNKQSSNFGRVFYFPFPPEQLVANIILMGTHGNLLIDQCTVILFRIEFECIEVSLDADIVGHI